MLQVDLTARVRKTFGKGNARALRRAGLTPAVLYGPKIDSMALELSSKSFTKALFGFHRRNAVISLEIENGDLSAKRHVMIREVQTDPVQGTLVHADFLEISLDTPVKLFVDLKFTGKPKGFESGGELQVAKSKVYLDALPLDFPDCVEVDITHLDIGDSVTCKDLNLSDKVTLLEKENATCATVAVAQIVDDTLLEEEEGHEEATAESSEEESASGSEKE
ncbi:MAG: 50S ribosomal protein L25 [Thermodesulfobacteriota bacterium]|nr:50S ribosomal protein L25 [Thermodesulfobacteriota bacterium]